MSKLTWLDKGHYRYKSNGKPVLCYCDLPGDHSIQNVETSTWYCNKCKTVVSNMIGTNDRSFWYCSSCHKDVAAHPKKAAKLDVPNPPTQNLDVAQATKQVIKDHEGALRALGDTLEEQLKQILSEEIDWEKTNQHQDQAINPIFWKTKSQARVIADLMKLIDSEANKRVVAELRALTGGWLPYDEHYPVVTVKAITDRIETLTKEIEL